jgi:uncharacterized Tic20 family protein
MAESKLVLGKTKKEKRNVLITLFLISVISLIVGVVELAFGITSFIGIFIEVIAITVWLFTSVMFFVNMGSYLMALQENN